MSETEALLSTKRIFCHSATTAPLQMCANAQNHRPFAQWNLISRTCNIPNHWKSM